MKRTLLLAAAAVCAFANLSSAHAQTLNASGNVSVDDRSRPEYDALGVSVGGFVVKPSVTTEVAAIDNVFATAQNEQDDVFVTVLPRIDVQSQWSRHAVGVVLGADVVYPQDFDSEHVSDEFIAANGRFDLMRDTAVELGGRLAGVTERRGAPDTPLNAAKLGRYEVSEAYVGLARTGSRIALSGRLSSTFYNYRDVPLRDGAVLDQDVRDHTETVLTGRLGVAISPDTSIFGQASANKRDYRNNFGVARDSDGSAFRVGARFDLTRLASGEASIGYFSQDYDDPSIGEVDGVSFDAGIDYYLSDLTTIELDASRNVVETAAGVATAFVSSTGRVEIAHELRRNVILVGALTRTEREFQGSERNDTVDSVSLGARYLVNRHASVGATYAFDRQSSSGRDSGPEFEVNKFGVSLTLKI